MIAAARAVKKIADEEATRAGAPLRKGKRSIKLRARDEIEGTAGIVRCRVRGFPVGPWVWVTDGAAPHLIPRARKRAAKKARYLGGGLSHPVRVPPGVIHHPGSPPRDAWRKVRARSEKVVPEIFRDDVARVVR